VSPLVTPDVIEAACIDLLDRRHPEHLAALEVERGLAAQTIERLRTIDLLIGEGVRLREDKPPVALLGIFGTEAPPDRDKNGRLTFNWILAVQIVVVGVDRRDTIKRRGWYAMTIGQCIAGRLPRHADPVDAIALIDVDFTNGRSQEERPRTVGEAQLMFSVRVRESMDLMSLPPDDSPLPPGSPGGPPAAPYTPPEPWPTASSVKSTTEREPL
jgi:hypothetical protein